MDKQTARLMEERTPLVPQCTLVEEDGAKVTFCSRADGNFCGAYAWPEKKWARFDCPMADSFLKQKEEATTDKKKVNPIKASKRAR